jgi:hypothetical protein
MSFYLEKYSGNSLSFFSLLSLSLSLSLSQLVSIIVDNASQAEMRSESRFAV